MLLLPQFRLPPGRCPVGIGSRCFFPLLLVAVVVLFMRLLGRRVVICPSRGIRWPHRLRITSWLPCLAKRMELSKIPRPARAEITVWPNAIRSPYNTEVLHSVFWLVSRTSYNYTSWRVHKYFVPYLFLTQKPVSFAKILRFSIVLYYNSLRLNSARCFWFGVSFAHFTPFRNLLKCFANVSTARARAHKIYIEIGWGIKTCYIFT